MKRLHVHVSVENLRRSIGFYSTLFGAEPTVVKPDYAKWMLDDPRVNFAISDRTVEIGVDHLGIQVDSAEELAEVAGRLKAAGTETRDQENTTCCYARSDKSWVKDPSGIDWETFHSFGSAVSYGEDAEAETTSSMPKAACCGSAPKAEGAPACC